MALFPRTQDIKLDLVLLPAGLKSADTMRVFCKEEEEEEDFLHLISQLRADHMPNVRCDMCSPAPLCPVYRLHRVDQAMDCHQAEAHHHCT